MHEDLFEMKTTRPPRPHLRGPMRLALCALMALMASPSVSQSEFTFRLIPEAHWNNAAPDRSTLLPEGEVYLYRAGSYQPDLVARVDVPQALTPDHWHWIAEGRDAEGTPYVSVDSGSIIYPEGAPRFDRGIIGPVAPACALDLGAAADWAGVERIDAVSPDRGSVFPLVIGTRSSFLVPAGPFIVYTMGSDGVSGISPVQTCTVGESVELSRPEPPASDRQHLMVSVPLPPSDEDRSPDLSAELAPFDESSPLSPQPAATALRSEFRTTFFFLDANARTPLVLEIRHPDFFPYRQEISPTPGGVVELPDVVLEPRAGSRDESEK